MGPVSLSRPTSHAALMRRVLALELAVGDPNAAGAKLDAVRADPTRLMSTAGLPPDPWQEGLLRDPADRTLILCSRQAGKSTVAAALACEPPCWNHDRLCFCSAQRLPNQANSSEKCSIYTLLWAARCQSPPKVRCDWS